MIPISLRFKAFESYMDEQFIDFTKLSDGGLFLINGETGAGKSAILDAMTYALYGETSGGIREEVRCLYASAEKIPTEVEFIFEADGKRYRFSREIRLTKGGNIQRTQNAEYLESDEFCTFSANPTMTVVREKAQELLGLTAEQFRQIVVLPQGQFEKFLVSDAGEKEKILTTLFHAEKYTEISNSLKAQFNRKNAEVSAKRAELSGLLKGAGFENIDGLDGRLTELSEKKSSVSEEILALETEIKTAEKALEKDKAMNAVFEQFDGEKLRRGELISRGDEMKALEEKLSRGKSALSLAEPFRLCSAAEKEFSQRESDVTASRGQHEELSRRFNKANERHSKLENQSSEQEKLSAELAGLKGLIPVYEEISKALSEEKSAKERLDSVCLQLESTETRFQKNAADEETLSAEIKEINAKFIAEIPSLKAEKITLDAVRDKKTDLLKHQKLLDKIRADVEILRRNAEKAHSDWQVCRKKFDSAYSAQLSDLAAALAEKLSDGEPCPVCGSVHHPSPFKGNHAESTDSANLRQLKGAADSAKEIYESAVQQYNREFPQIAQVEEYTEKLANEIERSGYSDERYYEVSEKLSAAESYREKLPALDEKLDALKKTTAELSKKKNILFTEKLKETKLYSEKHSRAELLKEQLKADIPDSQALSERIGALEEKISSYKKDFADSSELCRELSVKLAAAESTLAQAEKELKKSETALKESSENFEVLLAERGFKDTDDWRGALADEEELSRLEEEISSYKMNLFACEDRLKKLSEELSDKERPDLKAKTVAFSVLNEKHSELSAESAVLAEEEKRLTKLKKDYSRSAARLEEDLAEAEELRAFAELFVGSHGQSFTRFVLGTMLSMITAEANRLLANVHGGQFRICRKTENFGNKGKTGLELEVQSAMAAVPYSVKNLSGGEKFLVSLALSMALSSILRSRSGGISIDAMFIDEGFGSLDEQSLREALNILVKSAGNRRTVGIISHVSELKELLNNRIEVTKNENGSSLKMILS